MKNDFVTEIGLKKFAQRKKTALSKADFSRKGSIDEPLVAWVELVNSCPSTFTTSCCSGRVAITRQPEAGVTQKEGLDWVFMSHEKIDEDLRQKVKESINGRLTEKGVITFKFEGVIGHFCVESLPLAKQLLDGARLAGLRNSGIAIGANGKFTVQLRGTTALEVPLADNGVLMVTEAYLDWLINVANEKFDQNQKMIDKLYSEHSKLLKS